jgi:hypothetical protein
MAQARKDNNAIPVILGTSNSDGITPVQIKVSTTTHGLMTDDNTTGTDLSGDIASRDDNGFPVLMGVSSTDGITPTAVYADPSTGKILITST